MMEIFKLSNEKTVLIKRITLEDFIENDNYEFLHNWLHKVNKYLTYYFNPEELEKNKQNYFESLKSKDRIYIGAFYQNKIIGQIHLDNRAPDSKAKHVGTWGIAVHPEFQNQKLGAKFIRIIEKIAKEKGLKKLETSFVKENSIAEILYIKNLGYKIEGVRKNSFLLDNKKNLYSDMILIGKEI